jgi:hypothetical protein
VSGRPPRAEVWLVACAAAVLVGAGLYAIRRLPPAGGTGSSYAAGRDGALGLYRYLRAVGLDTRRLLAGTPREDADLLELAPGRLPAGTLRAARQGAGVLVAGVSPPILRRLGIRAGGEVLGPGGVPYTALGGGRTWHVAQRLDGATIALRRRWGRGGVVVVGGVYPFTNGALAAGSGRIAVRLLSLLPAGRSIVFDERPHLPASAALPNAAWGLAALVAGGACALWRQLTRTAPPRPEPEPESLVTWPEVLAGLVRRTRDGPVAAVAWLAEAAGREAPPLPPRPRLRDLVRVANRILDAGGRGR